MKIVVNYLNFVFLTEVKTKSNDKFLNFVFQFIKNTKWHFGCTDCSSSFYLPIAGNIKIITAVTSETS